MVIRRIIAILFILVYVTVSVGAYAIFGFSNTLVNKEFYEETVSEDIYEFIVNVSARKMVEEEAIAAYFNETEIRREVLNVFPYSSFKMMVAQITSQVDELDGKGDSPIVIRLSTLRESLLTLAHTLSYRIFEKTKKCSVGEIPEENEMGIPSCIPQGVEYNMIFGVLDDKFERAVYNAVPEQVQVDLNTSIGNNGESISLVLANKETGMIIVYVTMIVLIMLIALIIFKPFATIMTYEGIAFILSGLFGVVIKQGLNVLSFGIADNIEDIVVREESRVLIGKIIMAFGDEVQKAALISIGLGVVLILLRIFIYHKNV